MEIFDTSKARLMLGDTLECLSTIPDSSVDLVLTDPPYCSGSSREAGKTASNKTMAGAKDRDAWFGSDSMSSSAAAFFMRSCAVEWRRVLRPNGQLLCFIDWRMMPLYADAIESADMRRAGLVVWDKESIALGRYFRAQHELVMHFTKGVGWPQLRNDASNVIRHPRVRGGDHPTEKPVGLLTKLMNVVCPADGVVLDPFFGSGSCAVASLQSGRSFVGIERERRFFDVASARVASIDEIKHAA